jgi:hypothetical protein
MLAEMREHPGGSALNIATSAEVQPGSLRCAAFIERVPREHGWHVQRLCEGPRLSIRLHTHGTIVIEKPS